MPKESEAPLSLSDCHCNICMDIFVEPVTLPCHHTLCNACFQLTVEKASLCCPFCRRRVSSWARYNSRKNTLINLELWEKIKKHFPEECQRRINGQDLENDWRMPHPIPCLSKPGELRKEYEAEITKNRSTEESVQSSLLPGPSPSDRCKTSKNKSSNFGDIKKYLSPKSCGVLPPKLLFGKLKEENIDSLSRESIRTKTSFTLEDEETEDYMTILSSETLKEGKMTKDSPLDSSDPHLNICTTSEFNCRGPELLSFSRNQLNEPTAEHVTHREDCETECFFSMSSASGNNDFGNGNFTESAHLLKLEKNNTEKILISLTSSIQQESKDMTCEETKVMGNCPTGNEKQSYSLITKEIPKRKSQESPTESAVDSYLNDKRRRTFVQEEEMNDVQNQIYLEQQLYERYKQEEEDRHLALKIQKEMDREQKTLNRKKGSPNEYHLRPMTSQSVRKSPAVRKHCKLSKASNSQTEINQPKLHRCFHSENGKTSSTHQTKSTVKSGNVLNCVLNNSDLKDVELLPIKQRTIIQMFKRSATN
ncbi:E3 ubiquitin-protein ligase RNF168 isoform X2 [Candoia aspera]|uniref:E3 ubiquitin-protein ligase RNF168 isoform X2 n=1 Tax=Candoia aspera TaxID=51853 RepID=UPI002FD7AA47